MVSNCKETCPAGHHYDTVRGSCQPCGNGRYQPEEGAFFCFMCGVGLTTRTPEALTRDECRPECEDGEYLDVQGNCLPCPLGQYRQKGVDLGCQSCPKGFTTSRPGSTAASDCSLPICLAGQYLDAVTNECTLCGLGFYQPDDQQTECLPCPADTTTKREGATAKEECSNRCQEGEQELCDKNAICLFNSFNNTHSCECKLGYAGSGQWGDCRDVCENRCRNEGTCLKDKLGNAPNFYYGAPAPYAESIAPSHHSTYAHYYDDEEDGWEMPNFYNDTRSNASLYGGNKDDLYDRLRRHAYQGKKSDKSGNETTSDSDGQ